MLPGMNTAMLLAADQMPDISKIFAMTSWVGNDAIRNITNGIDADLVWTKNRFNADTSTYYGPCYLFDRNRGATKHLRLSSADSELTEANSLTAFLANGFSLGNSAMTNRSSNTYIGWSFKQADRFFKTVAFTHTNGINSVVDLSSLGGVGFATIKGRSVATSFWESWHRALGNVYRLDFNSAGGATTTGVRISVTGTTLTFSSTAPTGNYVLYAWAHDPDGVINAGSYVGSGVAGKQVSTGWKPQYVWVKCATSTGGWLCVDSRRGVGDDGTGRSIELNNDSNEVSPNASNGITITSSGFTLNSGFGATNNNGYDYIYLAIREPGP